MPSVLGVGADSPAIRQPPTPSTDGTLIYLNAGPRLDDTLARVAAAGGRITTPKVQLPDGMGCFAHVSDTEGNRIGLHALN